MRGKDRKAKKIRKEFLPWITRELNKDNVSFAIDYDTFEENGNQYNKIISQLNAKDFHKYVDRAMCEKESIELHSGRPVLSYRMYISSDFESIETFHMLKKDEAKILSCYA